MSWKLRLALASGGLCTFVLAAGCGVNSVNSATSASGAAAEKYAELPGLQASPNSQLQAELELLKQEQATPIQLVSHEAVGRQRNYGIEPPTIRIERAFPALGRNLLAEEIDGLFPTETVHLRGAERQRARVLLRRQAAARELFRMAIPLDEAGLELQHQLGLLADFGFLDSLRIGCRLEILDAADDLSEHRLEAALNALEVLLRVAHVLSAEKCLTARLTAVEIRADALRIVETITRHRFASAQIHEQIQEMLRREIDAWPPDTDAWIGDRALGLHTYELVRDGNFLSLLNADEVARLEGKGLLKSTAQAALKNVDADELFYLQAMRRLIDVSRRPYYERTAVLVQIRQELTASEETAEYPLVAGTILLSDFERGQRMQAEDAARMVAWHYALQLALNSEATVPTPLNPLTGREFTVLREDKRLVVSGILPGVDRTVSLRLFASPTLAGIPLESEQH
jgi:hypothetical protein